MPLPYACISSYHPHPHLWLKLSHSTSLASSLSPWVCTGIPVQIRHACEGFPPWPAPEEEHHAIFPSAPSPPLLLSLPLFLWRWLGVNSSGLPCCSACGGSPAGTFPLPQLVGHSPWGTLCTLVLYVAVGPYMNHWLSWLRGIWLPDTLIRWIFNHLTQLYCVLFRFSCQPKSQLDMLPPPTLWHIFSGRFNSTLFNFNHCNAMYVEMSLYLAVHSHLFHLCSLLMCRKCPVASTWLCLLLSVSAGIHSTGRVMLRVFICFPMIYMLSAVWML